MIHFFYVACTVLLSFFLELVFDRYISLFNAAPQVMLLVVVAHGFLFGPTMGEMMGFFGGLLCDSMGTSLFGLNAFVLTLVGYISGGLRRRVASERAAGQLVIAVLTTIFYWLIIPFISSLFEEGTGRIPYLRLILEVFLNVIFVSVVFWVIDHWIEMWSLEREHM